MIPPKNGHFTHIDPKLDTKCPPFHCFILCTSSTFQFFIHVIILIFNFSSIVWFFSSTFHSLCNLFLLFYPWCKFNYQLFILYAIFIHYATFLHIFNLLYVQPRQKKLIIHINWLLVKISMTSTSSKKRFVNNKCSPIIPQPLCCLAIDIPCETHPMIKWLITFLFFGLCLSLRQHNHLLGDGLFNSIFFFQNESLPQPLPFLE